MQKLEVAKWIRAAAVDAHTNDLAIEGHRVLSGLIEVAVKSTPAPYELSHIKELIYIWSPTYRVLTPQAQAIAARTDQRMRDIWSRLQAAGINISHRSAPGPVQLY